MSTLRPAAVAGMFYPRDPAALRAQVAGFLREVPPPPQPNTTPKMLVVPHAGTVYSGPIAARAYARLAAARGRIERVVMLGPAHRVPLRGLAAPSCSAFDTPLGPVRVAAAEVAALVDAMPQVEFNDRAHANEHALEVQLPFLLEVLGDVEMIPLLVGNATRDEVAQVVERLWGGSETLILISSDLSHYRRYADAQAVDGATVQRIAGFDATIAHDEACGATPINGALLAARAHGLQPRVLDLRNSGDTAGDRDRVVGYCAIEWTAPAGGTASIDDRDQAGDMLGPALIARARNAIAEQLSLATLPEGDHPRLHEPGATFVTLRLFGELRGCAGRLRARSRLADDVRRSAVAAAFEDTRFTPCGAAEFAALDISVSLLDAPQPLVANSEAEAVRALRPGIDGVVLRWRGTEATLLPQVWQQIADPARFLSALKRKAGLPADFWAGGIELSRYRVQHFDDRQGHAPH